MRKQKKKSDFWNLTKIKETAKDSRRRAPKNDAAFATRVTLEMRKRRIALADTMPERSTFSSSPSTSPPDDIIKY